MARDFPVTTRREGGAELGISIAFGGVLSGAGPHATLANYGYAVTMTAGVENAVTLPDASAGAVPLDAVVNLSILSFMQGARVKISTTGGAILAGLGAATVDGDSSITLQGIGSYIFRYAGEPFGPPGIWSVEQNQSYDVTSTPHRRLVTVATAAALPAYTPSGSGPDQILTADANGELSVDGVLASAMLNRGDGRGGVLVKNETGADRVYHGFWDVIADGDGSNPWILRRRPDWAWRLQTEIGAVAQATQGAQAGSTFIAPPLSGTFGTVQFDWVVAASGGGLADTSDDQTVQTTNATPTLLLSYATLADERAIEMSVTVWGRETSTDASAKYVVEVLANRATGSVVTILDENFVSLFEDLAAWDLTFVVNAQAIEVYVTGEGGKTIEWRGQLEVSEHG